MGERLKKLQDSHFTIIGLRFLGYTYSAIAEQVGVSESVVSGVVSSEMGQELLTSMRNKSISSTISLRQDFQDLLLTHKELPVQMMEGYVVVPVFDQDTGELLRTKKKIVDPELRLRAFKTVAEIAGVTQQNQPQTVLSDFERLEAIKEKSRALRNIPLAENAEFVEIDSKSGDSK